jgi:fibronectin type 3 domain-containing protein
MKTTIGTIAYLILLTFGFVLSGFTAHAQITIMPLGDSITAGVDYYTVTAGGYRDPLYHDLIASGISFTFVGVNNNTNNFGSNTPALVNAGQDSNNGFGGYQIIDIYNNLDGVANPVGGGASNQGGYWLTGGGGTGRGAVTPTIILLEIGANDILQGASASTTATNLGNLLDKIHTLTPSTTVLVAGIAPFNSAGFNTTISAYNSAIQSSVLPGRSFAKYVDNYTPFFNNSDGSLNTLLLGTDNVHPTRYGYPILALDWAKAIRTLEGSNPTTYALTVANGTGGGSYPAGSIVSINSNIPTGGNQFASWSSTTGITENPYFQDATLVMPAAATTITANYAATGSVTIPDGTYNVVGATPLYQMNFASGLSMGAAGSSNGSLVQQQTYSGAATQKWDLTNLGNNVVKLLLTGTSTALEVPGASTTTGANLDVSTYTGATSQQWTLTSLMGTTEIVNVNSGQAVNMSGYSTTPGSQLVQYTAGYAVNQIWTFYPLSGGGGGGVPPAPTGLTATAGNTQVSLSWSASSGATSYNVYRGTTAGGERSTAIATGITTATYTNTGLTNGTAYYYKVAAVNSSGTSGYSNEASATPVVAVPAAPTGLNATAGNTQISLGWTASSGATSYNVYRGTSAGGESGTAIATGITTTSYTNTGLTNGTAYYFKVAAVNASGTSGYSNEASATPTAGTSSQITWGTAQSMVGNTDVSAAGVAFDAATFAATAQTVNGVTFNPLVASGTVNGLQGYSDGKISANSPSGNPGAYGTAFTSASPSSAAYSAVTSVIGFGYFYNGTIVLSGLTTGHTYQVQVWSDYNGSPGNCNTTLTGANTVTLIPDAGKYAIGTFTAGSTSLSFNYNYGNDYGVVSAISVRDTTSGGSSPAAPTGLTATAGNTQVGLSWTASSGATSYNVYRGTSAGGESTTAIATGITSTSYTNTGLTNGTAYYYKVAAVSSYGTSGYSNEANATPVAAIPTAPTGLSATGGNTQISLGWTASSGATSYNVYRGTSAGGESGTAIATGITTTTYTNTGLTNGMAYYYKVAAVNSSGTSGYSNEASATPTAGTSSQITWGTAQAMVGNTDVSTTGTLLDAATFCTTAQTVNGVTFNPLAASGTIGGYTGYTDASGKISANSPGNAPGAYGGTFSTASPSSAAYSAATATLGFGYFQNGSVVLSGLTTGHTYRVQVWSYYTGSPGNCNTTLTGANTVTLVPDSGQYAIGTFTAGSTSLTFNYNYGNDYGLINAVEVRDTTP